MLMHIFRQEIMCTSVPGVFSGEHYAASLLYLSMEICIPCHTYLFRIISCHACMHVYISRIGASSAAGRLPDDPNPDALSGWTCRIRSLCSTLSVPGSAAGTTTTHPHYVGEGKAYIPCQPHCSTDFSQISNAHQVGCICIHILSCISPLHHWILQLEHLYQCPPPLHCQAHCMASALFVVDAD